MRDHYKHSKEQFCVEGEQLITHGVSTQSAYKYFTDLELKVAATMSASDLISEERGTEFELPSDKI